MDNRREMIDEILERVETELDELNNIQLEALIAEYEHAPLLGAIVESLAELSEETDEDEEKDEELPLIDGDWNELDEED